jgi:hypothetical protein
MFLHSQNITRSGGLYQTAKTLVITTVMGFIACPDAFGRQEEDDEIKGEGIL